MVNFAKANNIRYSIQSKINIRLNTDVVYYTTNVNSPEIPILITVTLQYTNRVKSSITSGMVMLGVGQATSLITCLNIMLTNCEDSGKAIIGQLSQIKIIASSWSLIICISISNW